ncbi:hypothetical protein AT959_00370 [Dechloromonas denitrificans]|uniref:Uncharacterized protein n=2 Tax=Dechloromonas denitrificans TaxID=281362 RepID=A0A133XP30_9RHOO|nr:hypothetical protein AT959_00370 [Dechloromonas denitrificans]
MGVSLLVCVSAASWFASKPLAHGLDATKRDHGKVEMTPTALLMRTELLTSACELAIRRSLEVAPELLALASWPLDTNEPVECSGNDVVLTAMPEIPTLPENDFPDLETVDRRGQTNSAEVGQKKTEKLTQAPAGSTRSPFDNNLLVLADESLDDIRGGFEFADSALKVSFGIERAVFINGQLVTSTVLNVKDLQAAVGGGVPQVVVASNMPGSVGLVQNGAGNGIAAQVGANLGGTVIQNTLNNQTIQNVTTINATVNSAQMMRAMSVQSAVHDGIVNSLRR